MSSSISWRYLSYFLLAGWASGVTGCQSHHPAVQPTGPPVVTVSQPLVKSLIDYDLYTGRTEAVKTVEVRARVHGELAQPRFQDGDLVKKDKLLFEIDPRTYEADLKAAQGQKASAEASLQLAEAEYERTLKLIPSKSASQTDLEVWKAKRGIALADITRADASIRQAQLNLEFTKIKAPIDGRISRPLVTEGNLVNTPGSDTLLTTIVSIDPMYVYFDVDERALLRYQSLHRDKKGKKQTLKDAKVPVFMALAINENEFPYEGLLDFAENKLDATTGTIRVRGVFANKDQELTPGLFARVRVPVTDPYQALLVSDRAIGTDQGQKFLLVVNDQNKVEYRLVRPGRLEGDLRVFQPGMGLKAGEWVIVNGIQRVRPGIEVKPERVPMPVRPRENQQKP